MPRWRMAAWALLPAALAASLPIRVLGDKSDAVMRSMSKDGAFSNTDKDLFSNSVQTSKSSIARDMLGAFYEDGKDLERQKRYPEALDTYEKILSIDPDYLDVRSRRDNLVKSRETAASSQARQSAGALIRQGDQALAKGLSMQAISFWKQALSVDPNNAAAQKKISDLNKAMARRQFEAGYIHYKHNELEDALDSWQNAIAFDPTLKNRGLMLLMSKVELSLRREQISRLANQGYDQYQAGDLKAALASYKEVLANDPRHTEARKSLAKISNQLGAEELKAAKQAAAANQYAKALEHYKNSLDYGWEPVKAKKGADEMTRQIELAKLPPPKPHKPATERPKKAVDPIPAAEIDKPDVPAEPKAVDAKAAKEHYRQGLAAVRNKDYQRGVQELELAQQMDSTDERIYMALQRARQEWREAASGSAAP